MLGLRRHLQANEAYYVFGVIAIVVAGYVAAVTVVPPWEPRPLFYNTWGISEKGGFLPEWQPDGILTSNPNGLLVLIDLEANQIAAIERPQATTLWTSFQFNETGASIQCEDEEAILVPKRLDSVQIVNRSHAVRRFAIRPGSAQQLFNEVMSRRVEQDQFFAFLESFEQNSDQP